jgi:hypothetical protein
MKKFGFTKEKVRSGWKRLHNEKFITLTMPQVLSGRSKQGE